MPSSKSLISYLDDKLVNSFVGHFINYIIISSELLLLSRYHDKEKLKLVREVVFEDMPALMKPSEYLVLYSLAKNQANVSGDFAEVGVYKGSSAKVICEAKENKKMHLFDTFDGMPPTGDNDSKFKENLFKSDIQNVKKRLKKYDNLFFYKGTFQKTKKSVNKKKFSLVHLDVDLYESTIECLNFFYPKMSKNGIIISHDYHIDGVKKALDEFFKDKPENIMQLHLSQCMIIKK